MNHENSKIGQMKATVKFCACLFCCKKKKKALRHTSIHQPFQQNESILICKQICKWLPYLWLSLCCEGMNWVTQTNWVGQHCCVWHSINTQYTCLSVCVWAADMCLKLHNSCVIASICSILTVNLASLEKKLWKNHHAQSV